MTTSSPRLQVVNDTGLRYVAADGDQRLQSFAVLMDGGSLQVWASVLGSDIDALAYLTPQEAMAFAKAFERCAIQALKETS